MKGFIRITSKRIVFIISIFTLASLKTLAFADTVYLKNGRTIEGLVKKENNDKLELDVGFGTVTFRRDEIIRVVKSTPQDVPRIKQKWQNQKNEADKRELTRQLDIEKDKESQRIELVQNQGAIFVDALINNKAHATLVLDTGASITAITEKVAAKLGIKMSSVKETLQVQLADGRKVEAKVIVLENIKIKNVETYNVAAAIIPNTVGDAGFKDGLLGMSFLKNFNFTVDQKNNKLILEKIR